MEGSAGKYLKGVRARLQLGVREVQEASAVIANDQGNPSFYVAASRLAQIENDESIPGVYKIFSLCAIYGLSFYDLLSKYGVDPNKARHYRDRFLSEVTRPVTGEVYGFEDTVRLPVRLNPSFRWETTQLINRIVALWGEVPAAFLIGHNPRLHAYGYVGLADKTMFPLVRPGSLLLIDPERRRVAKNSWTDEFDRPIYFVELRSGYRCAWCQLEGSRLVLISHPHSGEPVRTFSLESEAEIVGQVVGVATRLVPVSKPSREPAPRLAKLTEIVK
jgi:transcriptional regulator with XRE-family HTH domain